MNSITLRHIPGSTPLRNEVTYIESEYNEAVNAFITQYYDNLQRNFVMHELTLNYLPVVYSQLSNSRSIHYYQPTAEPNLAERLNTLTTADYTSLLALTGQTIQPMLIRFITSDGLFDIYESVPLDPDGDLAEQFFHFIALNCIDPFFLMGNPPDDDEEKHCFCMSEDIDMSKAESVVCEDELSPRSVSRRTDRFMPKPIRERACECERIKEADDSWDDDMQQALEEARRSVSRLLQSGIRETILRSLLFPEAKPSRLVVRYDYSIYLPEYNIDIDLRPIERAVYVLFLSHPEGIDFKSLPDYRRELGLIYDTIAQRTNSQFSDSVLDRITNPFDNSINEKCSRIKKAFLRHFDDPKASLYYISGPQGGIKSIPITTHHDMVVWE